MSVLNTVAYCWKTVNGVPTWMAQYPTQANCTSGCSGCSWSVKSGFATQAAFESSVGSAWADIPDSTRALFLTKISPAYHVRAACPRTHVGLT